MVVDCILVKSGTSQSGYYLATKDEVIANKDSIVQQMEVWGFASFVDGTVSSFIFSKTSNLHIYILSTTMFED